ncbi:FAD binding domain protein [Marasmius fiardii PR-910]|nr:FAD binding domain protein [Marasmius fiardii PR-910]
MALIAKTVVLAIFSFIIPSSSNKCRILPTDEQAWPTQETWDSFNHSIDGRLIKTVPIGSPCHDPNFDQERCNAIRASWTTPDLHEEHPSSVMDTLFLNNTCNPFTARELPCEIGPYVQYAVNVSSPDHVIKTVQFVKEHNIRFVVKNTGHDYMGRSTGTGAVSVWMHHLQNITWFSDFSSATYSGPAVKAYAGVSSVDLAAFVNKKGSVVVGGECPTVGFAGGYIQGGGHSALTNLYGMAADQALEFEVITTQGQYLTASPTQNEDLFWALSGGGGGTYAIVWSVTVKAHPDIPVAAGSLNFPAAGISADAYWQAIQMYQSLIPEITDSKIWAMATYSTVGVQIGPIFAPNSSVSEVTKIFDPVVHFLQSLGVNYTFDILPYPNYLEAYQAMDIWTNTPVTTLLLGGRLIPRTLWKNNGKFKALKSVVRNLIESSGASAFEVAMRPTLEISGHPNNSILPAWRETQTMFLPFILYDPDTPFDQVVEDQTKITTQAMPSLKKLTPGSGSYLNEADADDPDFKQAFYGANYDKLLAIKDKWDPDQLLYGSVAVGGDRWHEEDDGRLCRT